MTTLIWVKQVGPTATKPSRLVARNGRETFTIPFAEAQDLADHRNTVGSGEAPYRVAAQGLARKLNRNGRLLASKHKKDWIFIFNPMG